MSDNIEAMLEAMEPSESSSLEPPVGFLRAVSRRRRRRMVSRVAGSTLVVVGGVSLAMLLLLRQPNVIDRVSSADPMIARSGLSDSSAIAIMRANAGVAPELLKLPEHHAAPMDPPMRMSLRVDPEQIERWVRQ